ncbi:Zinc/cadmium resistance protein [Paramyrothecium foliicola]|nr:Zinc/cadmium resistance protein [Paramyrothecium foliicola]
MPIVKFSRKHRLMATIAISLSVFITELIGCSTSSLALIADAFHYLSDLIGFSVALMAVMVTEGIKPAPPHFTYGWQRAVTLGAFFNGVFLLALGLSILVQAIERFVNLAEVENPQLILIVGAVGLGLNLLVMTLLHEAYKARQEISRPTNPGRDLGMFGALVHAVGDAINNIGVIISAIIVWKAEGRARYYADPGVGVFIAIMIFLTAAPLTKRSGSILLETAPEELDITAAKQDIERVGMSAQLSSQVLTDMLTIQISGIGSVKELHVWRLDQHRTLATVHLVITGDIALPIEAIPDSIGGCLRTFGVDTATIQVQRPPAVDAPIANDDN